ncbi:MAG: hypothetical protein ACYTFG_10790 [Planctomycetota bacterium]|jgi:hypothetical protein
MAGEPCTIHVYLGMEITWQDIFEVDQGYIEDEEVYSGVCRGPWRELGMEVWGDPQEVDWSNEDQIEEFFQRSLPIHLPENTSIRRIEGSTRTIFSVEVTTFIQEPSWCWHTLGMKSLNTLSERFIEIRDDLQLPNRDFGLITVLSPAGEPDA